MKDKKLYIINNIIRRLKDKASFTPNEDFIHFNIPSRLEYEEEFSGGFKKQTYKHITIKGDLFDDNELIIKETYYINLFGNIVGRAWELKYHDSVVSYKEINTHEFY